MNIDAISANTKVHDLSKIKAVENNLQVSSNKVSQVESQLKNLQVNKEEFNYLMKNRPLIKYRPARNSFIKSGDKKLLAESLGVNVNAVETYIQGIIDNNFEVGSKIDLKNDIKDVGLNDISLAKTYVYRHGKQNQVMSCLKDDLKDGTKILNNIYKTFDDNFVGVYTYYARPCHTLKNNDARTMHEIIDEQLNKALSEGSISEAEKLEVSNFALKKIYEIQNNPDIRQAFKFAWQNS